MCSAYAQCVGGDAVFAATIDRHEAERPLLSELDDTFDRLLLADS
jgi:hypothetical protein